MPQSWTIIIFAYNEESSVKKVIEKASSVLQQISPNEHEIVVVNDGSSDKTIQNASESALTVNNVKIISHPKNLGIGKALLSGYKQAQFENICAIPGDGQFNPEELLPFAEIAPKTVISFYRTQKTRYTLFRKFLSYCNKLLNHVFLNIKFKDVNWVKVYKRDFLECINPVLTSSLVESELCAKAARSNYNIIEVASVYHPRNGGESKGASYLTIVKALRETFRLYIVLHKKNKK